MSIILAVQTESRNVVPKTCAAATVLTAKTIVAYDTTSGLIIPAVAGTVRSGVAGLVYKAKAATTADINVDVEEIMPGVDYIANTTNNTSVTHNGQLMVLSSAGVVNNTGTTAAAGIVRQVGVLGAAADKKALFKFA